MKRLLSILLFTLLAATLAIAQNNYWNEVPGPYGGEFTLVQTPGDILYAVHETNWEETYRSIDQGQTWQPLLFLRTFYPDITDKQVYVKEGGTIFLRVNTANNTYFYKTNDDGQNWVATQPFPISFVETSNQVLVGVLGGSVQRSTNGGVSWTTVLSPDGASNYFYFVNKSLSGEIYLESRKYNFTVETAFLCRSTDNGLTWTQTEFDPDYKTFYITPSGTIFCRSALNMLRSVDGGASYSLSYNTSGLISNIIPLQSGRLIRFAGNSIVFSDNEGASWSIMSSVARGANKLQPTVRLANNKIFASGANNALHSSSDDGQTWELSMQGMRASQVEKLTIINDSTTYAYTPTGLWKTTNTGTDWQLMSETTIYRSLKDYFAVDDSGGVGVVRNERVLWAADGVNFSDITPSSGIHPQYNLFFINPISGDFYVSTQQGLKKSSDQGANWETALAENLVTYMASHTSGKMMAYSLSDRMFVSDENGQNWQPVALPAVNSFQSAHLAKNGTLFISDYRGSSNQRLWRSTDWGQTWELLPQLFRETDLIVNSTPGGYVVVADPFNGFYLSINNGQTWQNLPTPIYPSSQSDLFSSLFVDEQQYLYVGTTGHGLWKSKFPLNQGSIIKGNVWLDADADCSTTDYQEGLKARIVKAEKTDFTYFTTTDSLGAYAFLVDTGYYSLSANMPNGLWWLYCEAVQEIAVPDYFSTDSIDFVALALAECPLISVELGVSNMRRCFNNEIFVEYCNQGTQPAYDAWVDIELDPFMSFVSSTQPHSGPVNNIVRFFVGDVNSGDCGQFQLTVYINCDSTILGQTHCVTAHGFPDTLCFPVNNWSGADIRANVACQDSILLFKLQNVGDAPSQILDYIIIEDDVVMFQSNQDYAPAQSIEVPVTANGHTFRIESEQEPGHPFSNVAIAFQEGCGGYESLGFINQFSVNDRNPSWHRLCEPNTGSYDPNDKHGYPIGVGEDHRILPGQPIEYRIRYQNTGTDTAFTVVIRDTLDASLDPFTIVMGASSHTYNWQLEGPGILKFTFNNINLPDSNVNWEGSQGFIRFRISQKPNLPLGTQIRNRAGIYFDFNDPVITNETMHTIGFPDVISSTNQPTKKQTLVKILPNPAKEKAVFELPDEHLKDHRLMIFSPSGNPVYTIKTAQKHTTVPRNNLPAGAYGWVLQDPHGNPIESGVLIFE